MPSTGTRGSAPVSPLNRTGQLFQQQLREKQTRDAAKDVDIAAVKRQAFSDGRAEGVTYGFTEGWNALGHLLIEAGAITEDRLLAIVNAPADDASDTGYPAEALA